MHMHKELDNGMVYTIIEDILGFGRVVFIYDLN